MQPPESDVLNNIERHQFEIRSGDYLARLKYRERDGVIDLIHTEVPKAIAGQGFARRLAVAALDYAERQSLLVKPSCPYVQAFLRRHPEYQRLVVQQTDEVS